MEMNAPLAGALEPPEPMDLLYLLSVHSDDHGGREDIIRTRQIRRLSAVGCRRFCLIGNNKIQYSTRLQEGFDYFVGA